MSNRILAAACTLAFAAGAALATTTNVPSMPVDVADLRIEEGRLRGTAIEVIESGQ